MKICFLVLKEMNQMRHVLQSPMILLIIGFSIFDVFGNGVVLVRAQYPAGNRSGDVVSNFQPSLAVVIGILSIMFVITFSLLIYVKLCHRGGVLGQTGTNADNNAVTRSRRFSGIDKTVIESLPFFRFSSLKGSRAGLECSVCLAKFEDIEILRLLPKCKHAFHIDCIDHWLERHSTCPLCRYRVSPDDPSIFTYSSSMRLLNYSGQSERIQDPNSLEIFIEREEESNNIGSSSRFNIGIGSSFRKLFKAVSNNNTSRNDNKDEESLMIEDEEKMLHKFNHRIVMSDVVFQNRWSNLSSSDLMFLNSEMLNTLASDRFSALDLEDGNHITISWIAKDDDSIGKIKEEMERKRLFESKFSAINKTGIISSGPNYSTGNQSSSQPNNGYRKIVSVAEKRSQSEITAVSRFGGLNGRGNRKEERRRQLWLPIARRTVEWFANRERRSQPSHDQQQIINTRQITDSTAL